ncbi:MAG: hypothetical protein ACOYXA_08855 [Bacteroidota bacterium]
MSKRIVLLLLGAFTASQLFGQGFGIPSKRGGIGFGNLSHFTGIRFNFKNRDVERINGVNVTVWQGNEEDQSGTVNGIAIGLPLAMGAEEQNGLGLAVGGVGAKRNLSGINLAGLAVGAGESVRGISVAGLGVGAGEDLRGINVGGLGAGAGGNVSGFNFGGLGIGAGSNLSGFNFGGLGLGAGGKVKGISIGGLGIGAGDDLTGISASLIGIGAGGRVRGIQVAGIGIGGGEEVKGLSVAGVGIGGSRVTGIAIAPAVGGETIKGIMIAPAYFRVGSDNRQKLDAEEYDADMEGVMRGISVSAFNQIKGDQIGAAFGVVNYTHRIKGVQFGLINIVKENPRGLRVLPIFNTRFYKKG